MAGSEGPGDGELLAAFAERGDEAALEAVIRRHAGLVYAVCRRVLGPTPDAEDAAQAAFMTLARCASKLRREASAAAWLHRVARNLALNAARDRRSRQAREERAAAMRPQVQQAPPLSDEQGARLHAEVDALPEKYRRAVVHFHLEGRSLRETAELLGCPEATAGTWLARAREQLRDRLARRGMVLSVGALAALLCAETGAVELPASLVSALVAAAKTFAAASAAGGTALATPAAALAKGALQAMFYAKLKVAAVALVAVSLAGSATGVVWYHAQAGEAPAKPAEVKKEDRPAAPVAPAAGEALKPQADEALKLQVALTEIELRMAETKYSHLRKIAEQTELHFRAGVVTSSDRERDQLASELAQFGVEAAIVRLAQTRLGLPPPPAAPAAPLPSVEAAKLQVEEARIGLQVAQVKAKYAEMRTKWLKKVDAARGASQEDLGTAEMEHELASLAIQAALVGVKRAELALDQAAQTGVTPVGTVPPGARLRVQEVQGAKETEYVVEFNVTGITAGVLSMLAGTESLAKMDKGAVLTIRVNPAAGKGEVLVTYRLEVKTAQGQLTWEEKDAPFKTDEWVPMKAAGTGAP